MKRLIYRTTALSLFMLIASGPGMAAGQNTTTLNVTITINANCSIAATNLAFSTQGVLAAAVTSTSTVTVTCTNTTPYTVGLNAGTGAGNTETSRHMFGTTAGNTTSSIAHHLYKADLATELGDSTVAARVGGTGTGAAQVLTVNGAVPAQTTPAPDTYSSTVTATAYF